MKLEVKRVFNIVDTKFEQKITTRTTSCTGRNQVISHRKETGKNQSKFQRKTTKETSRIDRRKTYSNYIGKASGRAVTAKIQRPSKLVIEIV